MFVYIFIHLFVYLLINLLYIVCLFVCFLFIEHKDLVEYKSLLSVFVVFHLSC